MPNLAAIGNIENFVVSDGSEPFRQPERGQRFDGVSPKDRSVWRLSCAIIWWL